VDHLIEPAFSLALFGHPLQGAKKDHKGGEKEMGGDDGAKAMAIHRDGGT
jgi:hypothetical protein